MTQAKRAEESLSLPWLPVQAVIWLGGLAILAWQDWPLLGFLALIVVSAVAQGVILYDSRRRHATQAARRSAAQRLKPHTCPSCEGTLKLDEVRWTGTMAASCPYCGSALEFQDDPAKLVR